MDIVPKEIQDRAAEVVDAVIPSPAKQHKRGICHLLATDNATIIHLTDMTGRVTYVKVSGGTKVKSKKDEGSAYAGILAAQDAAARVLAYGIDTFDLYFRGRGGLKKNHAGLGGHAAVRAFFSTEGIRLGRIVPNTPIPHDTCRRKGGNRGRRM